MRNLISIIERNLKIIGRSKLSTFLVLLPPILIVMLVGTAFNSDSLSNIKVGIYSSGFNDLTESIMSNLEESGFASVKFSDNESCISAIWQGSVHACVVFPGGLSIKGNDEPVLVYVDNTRMNLAYFLINKINAGISQKGTELGRTMAHSLLEVLEKAKQSLPEQKSGVNSASSGADEVSLKSKEVADSLSSISDSLDYLDEALSLAKNINDSKASTIITKINNAKDSLNSLNDTSNINLIGGKSSNIKSDLDKIGSNLNELIISLSAISISNEENLIMPIKTEISTINKQSNWKTLFPTLTALIILLSGIVLSSTIVLGERRARAKFRNYLTPTSDTYFILGAYVTCLLMVLAQLVILFAGAVFLTNIEITNILPQIALILFVSSSVFVFLGILIGYLFRTSETTILTGISISAVLVFFSNAILPIESMSTTFNSIAKYNPLFLTDTLLKKVILFNTSIGYSELGILAGILAGLFILSLIARKITKRVS